MICNIKLALVYGKNENWLDRQIMNFSPTSKFSHGGFLVYYDDGEVNWVDVHFRWFTSDLRIFPSRNYGWDFSIWKINELTDDKIKNFEKWLQEKSSTNIVYDFPQALWQWISYKLGLQQDINYFNNPNYYQSAEFIIEGLKTLGVNIDAPKGFELYSHITNNTNIIMETKLIERSV